MKEFIRRLGPRYGISIALAILVVLIIAIGNLLPHSNRNASPEPPVTSPGAATPQTVATNFAEAWLRHTGVTAGEWRDAVARYSTEALSAQLSDTDPVSVPANRIVGALTLTDVTASYVEISIPTDSGTLILALQADRGQWLVSSVDWNRP